MADIKIESRVNDWGRANLTPAEMAHNLRFKLERKKLREALINGDIPPFDKNDNIAEDDIYDAGANNACPSTENLLKEMGGENLMNMYVTMNKAFRMIKRLLRTTGNEAVLKLWEGNIDQEKEEVRIDECQNGTPTKINELNQHVGVGKYEDVALCFFFYNLVKAETNKGKLYLPMEEYKDCTHDAKDLNDLSALIIEKTLPNMLKRGIKKEEVEKILFDCYLPEWLLIEDNVWTRAETTARCIGTKLAENKEKDLKTVGEMFLEKIPGEIQRMKKAIV